MFKDDVRAKVWERIRKQGSRELQSRLTPGVLKRAARRAGVTLGANPLNCAVLAWLGIAGAVQIGVEFAVVLSSTLQILTDQSLFQATQLGRVQKTKKSPRRRGSKHSPKGTNPAVVTEEAYCQARALMPLRFWQELIAVLIEVFESRHHRQLLFRGFRVLTMDGTEVDLPNWKALRDFFGQAKNKGGKHQPQARLVMLQLPFVRLPFRYELVALSEGENTLARRLTKHLRPKDLVLLDAGFWSFGLLCDIQSQNACFALRLKKGLKLQPLPKKLGRDDRLVRWTPCDSRGKWRREGLPKSIDLRVIRYQIPGYRVQEIVTNVLDPLAIPRAEWVRLTTDCEECGQLRPGLYHRRWEIETTYRELKVEQGMEKGLRSRTVASIQYEVASHIVLYLLVRWLMVEAAESHGLDPLRLSFKQALTELQSLRHSLIIASPRWTKILLSRLLERLASHVVPYRPGRHYIRRKKSSNYKRKSNSQNTQVAS